MKNISKFIEGSIIVILMTLCVMKLQSDTDSHGVHIVERKGLYGINCNDSVIVPAQYLCVDFLDKSRRYALLKQKGLICDSACLVFDIEEGEFIYNDIEFFSVVSLEEDKPYSYRLINPDIKWFATLNLSKDSASQVELIPHFNDSVITVGSFIDEGINGYERSMYVTFDKMKESNPEAFVLFEQINRMTDDKCSPASDLNKSQAVDYFIKNNSRYKGNYALAMKELFSLTKYYNLDGRDDMTQYGMVRHHLANISLSHLYADVLAQYQDYNQEYVAWHNLVEAIVRFSKYNTYNISGDWTYNGIMETELHFERGLECRRHYLDEELDLLKRNKAPAVNNSPLKTKDDVESLCGSFRSDLAGSYHPMWNEVYYSFMRWLDARENIAATLSAKQSQSYRYLTARNIDNIYHLIENTYMVK